MRLSSLYLLIASTASAAPLTLRSRLGLPVPLTVYGFNTQSDSVSTRRPIYGGLTLDLAWAPAWQAGLRVGGMTLVGEDGANSADVWFVSMGGHVRHQPVSGLSVTLGPSVLRNAIIIDENIRLDTWALGAAGGVGWAFALSDAWTIDAEVGLQTYLPPWNKATYFNQPLGRTVLLTLAVGVSWQITD
jgi:hypothetical protein